MIAIMYNIQEEICSIIFRVVTIPINKTIHNYMDEANLYAIELSNKQNIDRLENEVCRSVSMRIDLINYNQWW